MIEKFSALGEEAPLEPDNPAEFSLLDEPKDFSRNLVDWTEREFEMKDEDVVAIVRERKVCLESGKCVVPQDVGSNCCLF